MGKDVARCKYCVREIIGQGFKSYIETRILAKVGDVNCNGGRENGDKGTNLRFILGKNPGNLITD